MLPAELKDGTKTELKGRFGVDSHPQLKGRLTRLPTKRPDRAVVIYFQRRGPVTTQVEISYGNHAEIAGAVDAIKFCAQPR